MNTVLRVGVIWRPVEIDNRRLVALESINREAITFLAGVEAAGALLVNCPEYVRSWIDAEQGSA